MIPCIAKYLRVSLEDGDLRQNNGKDESNSIQNQRKLVESHIDADASLRALPAIEFVDDGYSGTNFERPGFQRMLDGIKAGTISCVIVKDLSRFGRNYLEVGDYLEHLFPFLGIRFIAINDAYDSANNPGKNVGIDLAFKNILHDYYSKDLSTKVRSAQRSRMQKGKYVNVPPYGYLCDPLDKHHLILDPNTAPIVRQIFTMIIHGASTSDVARHLNEISVPTPYEAKQTKRRSNMPEGTPLYWTHRIILNILHNYKYTGAMVNHTRENPSLRAKSQRRTGKEEWIINEGMHEAIVSRSEYDQALESLRTVRTHDRKERDDHDGVYYCAHCGKRLRKTYGVSTYLSCETATYLKDGPCKGIRWKLTDLEDMIADSFRIHLEYLTSMKTQRTQRKQKSADGFLAELSRLKSKIDRCQTEKMSLYTSYKLGALSKEDFLMKKSQLGEDIEQLEQQVERTKEEYELFLQETQTHSTDEQCFEDFLSTENLSRYEMLDLMYRGIEKVLLSEDGSIEIIWKYRDIFAAAEPSLAG